MTSFNKLTFCCLALVLVTIDALIAVGDTPVDQKPEFLGDVFFVDEAEQEAPSLRLLSTDIKLVLAEGGYGSYAEYVTVKYKVVNKSKDDTFKLALIGENLSIWSDGEIPFSRTYVKQDQLPEVIIESLDAYFDYYHDNTTLPINVFELNVEPDASTTFKIYYRNSRDQFANYYDDVCIFHFWLNPIFDGDVAMEFDIENSLDTSAVDTPNKELVYNSERLGFSQSFNPISGGKQRHFTAISVHT